VQGLHRPEPAPHRHANQLPMVVEKTIVQNQAGVSQLGRPQEPRAVRQRGPRSTVQPPSARCMRSSTATAR
jgi:hypothetical protein